MFPFDHHLVEHPPMKFFLVRKQVFGIFGNKHRTTVVFCQCLKPGSQVDGISQNRRIHSVFRTNGSNHHRSAVDSNTNFNFLIIMFFPVFVVTNQSPLHLQTGTDGVSGLIRILLFRMVKQSHDCVSNEFVDKPMVDPNRLRHEFQVGIEELHQLVRRHRFRKIGK